MNNIYSELQCPVKTLNVYEWVYLTFFCPELYVFSAQCQY